MQTSKITQPTFRKAVEAIDSGNVTSLQQLLNANAELVITRLDTPTEGYFAYPYLLWFVADNPIRREKLPPNIVEVTEIIIKALQANPHKSYQQQLNYALQLVCTGRIAKKCGAQIPLMELLINEGAQVKGSVLGALGQHNFEAAKYLLNKGFDYNLATAVGLNQIELIKNLVKDSSASELYVALVVASFFGYANIISFLIEAKADANGHGSLEDFGAFHSHASPLHHAVSSGSLASVILLVEAGANLDATDKAYNGTPLSWALYMRMEENDEVAKKKYREIETYLLAQYNR